MKDRYDEVKFNAGFYATSSLVYGYMAPVTFCDLIDFTAIFIPLFVYRIVYAFPYVISRIAPYGYLLNLATTRPLTVACFGNCIDSMITLFLLIKIVKLERKTEAIALS
uniref:Uncharacterized protein n=1 Tax=Acrobeloides nanus TaxID=290746 RepID=A0A914EG51_9BILA